MIDHPLGRDERLRLALDASGLGLWEWDLRTDEVFLSEGARRLLGYPPDAPDPGRAALADHLHPDDRGPVEEALRGFLARPHPGFQVEFRVRGGDGGLRWMEATATLIADGDGRPLRLVGSQVDITERRRTQEALARTERALRVLSASNQTLIRAQDEVTLLHDVCRIATDAPGGYQLAWVGFAEDDPERTVRPVAWSGPRAAYVQGLAVSWGDNPRGQGPTGRAIRSGQMMVSRNIVGEAAMEPWREQAQAHQLASSVALPLVVDGRTIGALHMYAAAPDAFDADESALLLEMAGDLAFGISTLRAQAERRREQQDLRALAARLQRVREEEQTRIARDLHDELGQLLTALRMDLSFAERRLGESPPSPQVSAARQRLGGAGQLVDQTVQVVQRLASELRPSVLTRLGLGAALAMEARRFQERSGVACELRSAEDLPRLPDLVATAMYRIAQEALTNVARHAAASLVRVSLEHGGDTLTLQVIDDGRGFVLDDRARHGLGLLGMRERAAAIGGRVTIGAGSPRGTVVTATAPLPDGEGG